MGARGTSKYFGKFNVGDQFGELTVINNVPDTHTTKIKCKCNCGALREIPANFLLDGHTKSCGCLKDKGMVGKRIGMLTVIKKLDIIVYNRRCAWECKCDCEKIVAIDSYRLRHNKVESCGCLKGKRPSIGKKSPLWKRKEEISGYFV